MAALRKSARPDRPIVYFHAGLGDKTLCPYIKRSATWRDGSEKNRLFQSINKPHHAVTPATIACWLKEMLRSAGISDTFSDRSTRATAVSVAFDKGVSITDIMNTANWTSDSVFCIPYWLCSCCSECIYQPL